MDFYHVTGQFQRHADGALEGWCWSPDRPEARLMVEFVADDTVVGSVRADQHSSDLIKRAVGDGRHAFLIGGSNMVIPDDATLLAAREISTGRIFGRLRLREPRAPDSRLDRLAASLDALRAALPRPDQRRSGAAQAGFAMVGARLDCPSDGLSGAASRLFARAYPPAEQCIRRLPFEAPKTTVVLWARRADEAAAAATALRKAATACLTEFFIVDAGHDARVSLFPTIFRDATFLHRPGGFSLDGATWSAAKDARGKNLVLIDGSGGPLSLAMLSEIGRRIDDKHIIVDRRVAGLVSPIGHPADINVPSAADLLLAVDRMLFEHVGGLDPSISADPMLAVADFCMRAALLGARTTWPGTSAPGPASGRHSPAPAALAVFRRRWGRLFGADPG